MEQKWWTLLAVCLGVFMLLIDVTVVNTALPDIQRELHSSFSDLQWVVNAYALTLAAFLLTAGAISDLVGRRKVFTTGLVVFTAASLACGLAQSPTMLNLSRGVQGIGGAIMLSSSLALIANAFRGRDRGTAFAVYGAVLGAAVAIGPLVGGGLTSGLGWRWIFIVNVPIGALGVVLTITRVAESRDPQARGVDWAGLVTFSSGLFLLIYALTQGNAKGWGSTEIVVCLALAIRAAHRVRDRRASPGAADVRPRAAAPPRVRRRVARRLRAVGVDVLALPLPHALHPERARLLAVRRRPALPADDRAAVLRLADLRQADRAHARPDHPRHGARADRRVARADGRPERELGLFASARGLHRRRAGDRDRHPGAGLDRRRGRAARPRRHGVGHQQHVPPGRDRRRRRKPRRDLPARGRGAHDGGPGPPRRQRGRAACDTRTARGELRLGRDGPPRPCAPAAPAPRRDRLL